MVRIELESGIALDVDEGISNDMEFVDALTDAIDAESYKDAVKSMVAYSHIVDKLLGKKGKKELYDRLRDEDGRVPIEAVSAATKEIMDKLQSKDGSVKN